jgi:hypothetical protein
MGRKTRKVKAKSSLKPFDFAIIDNLMSKNSAKCGEWQIDADPNCGPENAFFNGSPRVYNKYSGLFPDTYKRYIEMDVESLKNMIPRMPKKKCKQIVIGTGEDIILYVATNNKFKNMGLQKPFTLFTPPEWGVAENLLFTQCAVSHQINNCPYNFFLRILLPKDASRLFDSSGKARISMLEICTISKYVKDWGLESFILKTSAKFDYDIIFI